MDNPKTAIVEKIKAANTVLVTVSRNPSIDQLAACIGMALLLVKLKKHGTAVFSGQIPSTIEFLKPEATLEKNTDSLRDFIIALDKSKADKLRYKVEDQMVKIFITPYRTSLNEDDLEFSQGEFNIDLVVTLGVEKNADLDQAIMSNGNIFHDAPIISINNGNLPTYGSINWNVPQASSLCELVAELAGSLGDKLIDQQIATALLTGIVAQTARFSNSKTTSLTMSISSQLMAAGANQQLVATELAEGGMTPSPQEEAKKPAVKREDGELDINHRQVPNTSPPVDASVFPQPTPTPLVNPLDNQPKLVSQPPQLGGTLSANTSTPGLEPSTDPLSAAPLNTGSDDSYISTKPPTTVPPPIPPAMSTPSASASLPANFTPPPPAWVPPFQDKDLENKVEQDLSNPTSTITNLEESVSSPHVNQTNMDSARESVASALNGATPAIDIPKTDAPTTTPPQDGAEVANFQFPEELDPKDLTPPTDPKAPPYPPPLTPPPAP